MTSVAMVDDAHKVADVNQAGLVQEHDHVQDISLESKGFTSAAGIVKEHLQEREQDHVAETSDFTSTTSTEDDSSEAASSADSEHSSNYSATSASVEEYSTSSQTDTASDDDDDRKRDDDVKSLLEGHGVLSGWGQSDYFGGDFSCSRNGVGWASSGDAGRLVRAEKRLASLKQQNDSQYRAFNNNPSTS